MYIRAEFLGSISEKKEKEKRKKKKTLEEPCQTYNI